MFLDSCKNFFPPPQRIFKLLLFGTLIFVIITGIILRLKIYLCNQSFWMDEALLGANIERKYYTFFKPLINGQVAPPFFMVLSKFFLFISGQADNLQNKDFVLRFLPFLCSAFSVPVFALAAQKMFNNKYLTLFSTTVFSLNKTAISYAQEFKQYSSELLFSVLLILFFCCLDLKNISNKKLIFYSLFFALSPWFANSSLIILCTGFFILILQMIIDKYFDKIKTLILFVPMTASLILFFIYYAAVKKAMFEYMHNYWTVSLPSFFDFSNFCELFTVKNQYLIDFPYSHFLLPFLLLSILILFCTKNYKRIILIVFPVCLSILLSFLHQYPYEQRIILFLLPSFVLLYSQIALLIKNTKTSDIISSFAVLIFSFHMLFVPMQELILHKSYTRDLALILKNENSEMKNLIAGALDFQYYMPNSKGFEFENIWENYDEADFENKLKQFKKGEDIWILLCAHSKTYNKNQKIKEYIFKNYKNTKIWISPYDENIYLIKFGERK